MSDLEEQRKKVEELKKKILEEKKKGGTRENEVNASTAQNTIEQHSPHEQKSSPATTGTQQVTSQQQIAVSPLQAYVQALRQALSDGVISKDEEVLLATLRKTLGIRDEDHVKLIHEIRLEIYYHALCESWRDGMITEDDMQKLEQLRELFRITGDEHLKLEKMARQQLKKS